MKTYGSGCIDPHFLDLGTSWRWVVNFTPRPLYSRGRSSRYTLGRRLCGPQSRSRRRGEEKILDPTGIRTLNTWSSGPVANRYTDYATPAPELQKYTSIITYCSGRRVSDSAAFSGYPLSFYMSELLVLSTERVSQQKTKWQRAGVLKLCDVTTLKFTQSPLALKPNSADKFMSDCIVTAEP
jgi:hypothetical protein